MPYLNKDELAAELGVKKRGVEELMRRRVVPYFRLGHRTVRFDLAAVRRALAKYELRAIGGEGWR